MQYEDLIGIETPIKYKFQNKILPELVDIIRNYLFKNPSKLNLYLDERITAEGIIRYLCSIKELRENESLTIDIVLAKIVEYVEVIVWKLP